jgi:SAM-dependent methyltransferase
LSLFNKVGLEVGGPSGIFKNTIPVYRVAKRIDGCNFSNNTVWESTIKEGETYNYFKRKKPGHQYILDASNLSSISDEQYDFILSCHSLEHMANPLKAFSEFLRVIKPNGHVALILPNREVTFDHARPVTTMDHLISDYENDVQEDDLTHLDEILKLHDLSKDPEAGDLNNFRERSLKNIENRCLHHHVFDEKLIAEIFDRFGLELKTMKTINSMNITAFGRKLSRSYQSVGTFSKKNSISTANISR